MLGHNGLKIKFRASTSPTKKTKIITARNFLRLRYCLYGLTHILLVWPHTHTACTAFFTCIEISRDALVLGMGICLIFSMLNNGESRSPCTDHATFVTGYFNTCEKHCMLLAGHTCLVVEEVWFMRNYKVSHTVVLKVTYCTISTTPCSISVSSLLLDVPSLLPLPPSHIHLKLINYKF